MESDIGTFTPLGLQFQGIHLNNVKCVRASVHARIRVRACVCVVERYRLFVYYITGRQVSALN